MLNQVYILARLIAMFALLIREKTKPHLKAISENSPQNVARSCGL